MTLQDNYHYKVLKHRNPRIAFIIEGDWRNKSLVKYFDDLLFTDRDREGFPFDVIVSLQELHDLHKIEMPHLYPAPGVWDKN